MAGWFLSIFHIKKDLSCNISDAGNEKTWHGIEAGQLHVLLEFNEPDEALKEQGPALKITGGKD